MTDAVIRSINGFSSFVESSMPILPKAKQEESAAAMATSIEAQINGIVCLDEASATSLNNAIYAGKFAEGIKSKLGMAVTARLLAPGPASSPDSGRGQVLMHPYNYLTKSDWVYLGDLSKTLDQCALRVKQRMSLLGLVNPNEHTYAALASVIAAKRAPDFTQGTLHKIVMDLKSAVTQKAHPPGRSAWLVKVYPEQATEIPTTLHAAAYASELPEPQVLEHFEATLARCPRRKPKGLKGSHQQAASCTSIVPYAVASGAAGPSLQPAQMQEFMGMMVDFASKFVPKAPSIVIQKQPGAAGGGTPPTTPMRDAAGGGMLAITDASPGGAALPATPGPALPSPAAPVEDPDDVLKKYEAMAAKPADDAPMKSAEKAMKRPSACDAAPMKSAMAAMKRPAGKPAGKPASKSRKVELGCSRCRGSPLGCLSCRQPEFGGKRFQR